MERVWHVRNNYVEYYQTWPADGAFHFQAHSILVIQTLHNINVHEELYRDYGSSYDSDS